MTFFHHTAFLVEDLDAAIAHFESTMGLTFRPPIIPGFPHMRDRYGYEGPGGTERITYSTTGPMHVELMEAQGDGIWSPRYVGGVHHIGLFTADVQAIGTVLEASGYDWEGEIRLPDGEVAGAYYLHGALRYEILNASMHKSLMDWIEGRTAHPADAAQSHEPIAGASNRPGL
jgi:catechol 2,3-dioxygenase-like lactoylglutathione lyase family enzyme